MKHQATSQVRKEGRMVVVQKPSHSWWFDSHNSPRQSPWLISALSELDEKTKAMLKLIEEDADSFAQRAEMYYKKRPELVNMVEDFYRAHRSLAEQHNQLKLEVQSRHTTPFGSPHSTRSWSLKLGGPMDKSSRTSSVSFDSEESEIDDPEEVESDSNSSAKEFLNKESKGTDDEVIKKMAEETEKLKEEIKSLKDQLTEKDEEKREVIRQLCISMDILKEENTELKKCVKDILKEENEEFGKPSKDSKKKGLFDFKKLTMGVLSGKFFGAQSKSPTTLVAL